MAFDVQGALKEGYSEAEIVDYLAQQSKFDAAGARKEGYSDSEILQHLTTPKEPPKPKQQYPKLGLWDKVKAGAGKLADNLSKEVQDPVNAAKNLGLGVVKGASDVIDGGAQLASKGFAGWTGVVAPGSVVDKWAQSEASKVDSYNQDREDRYQKSTEGSVLAGAGRVGGNVVLPVGQLNAIPRGASLVSKAASGAKAGALLAAAQPVYGEEATSPEGYAKDKAIQMGVGATAGGAAPVVSKVSRELLAKLGVKSAEKSLTLDRAEALFKDNPNAKVDAEIITDLAKVKQSLNPEGTAKEVKLQASDLKGLSNVYINDLRMKLKAAGLDEPAIEQALMTHNQVGALPKDVLDRLNSTQAGQVTLDVIEKANRLRSLVPNEYASGGIAKVGRSVLDVLPIPAPVRYGGRAVLGSSSPRWQKAEDLIDSRTQKAATDFLTEQGPSKASSGVGILSQLAEQKASQDAAASKAPTKGVLSDYDIVENAIQKKKQAEYDKAIKEVDSGVKQAQVLKQKQADALNTQISKDPSLLIPDARDPRQFTKFSKVIRQQMEDRIKQEAADKMTKEAEKAAQEFGSLQIKARKISGTPGGGAYQALLEHTGLSKDDLNKALRIAENIPEAKEAIRAIRVNGENTAKDAIYPVTDIVKSIADKMGMSRAGDGVLTQRMSAGPLTQVEPVSAKYQMGTKVRQDIMKEAIAKASSLGSPEASKAAKDVGNKLRTTSSAKERLKLIEDLEMQYPETQGLFDAVKQFKK